MHRKQFRALIALNTALLLALAAVTLAPPAAAQAGRARGEYAMISGQIQGREESAIYLVDTANQEMVALIWDRQRNNLLPLGRRSLS
ncbi:MAG: hypothetical protein D6693_05645, partial [Planctomycetota bacterium]